MKYLIAVIFFVVAISAMVLLDASARNTWYWLVGIAVANSAIVSALLVWKSKKLDTFTTKAMGFGAWFWFLIFIQVMLYGFYTGLTK